MLKAEVLLRLLTSLSLVCTTSRSVRLRLTASSECFLRLRAGQHIVGVVASVSDGLAEGRFVQHFIVVLDLDFFGHHIQLDFLHAFERAEAFFDVDLAHAADGIRLDDDFLGWCRHGKEAEQGDEEK